MTLPLDRVLQQASPVLPVLVIEDVALAPDLARACMRAASRCWK